MARKKRKTRRSKARKSYRSYKKKSMKILGVDVMDDLVIPGGYGYARPSIAQGVTAVSSRIPLLDKLGDYKDEAAMIITGALASKFIGRKSPLIRKVARNMIRIEAASLGQQIRTKGFNPGANKNTSSNSFR